jgi:hypothetical protein
VTGHEGGQGGGTSLEDLKLSGVTLGAKEKVGGDKVENQELGAESLHVVYTSSTQGSHLNQNKSAMMHQSPKAM